MTRHRLPHLVGAMKMRGAPGNGLCVHRAAAFVLDTPGAELVFATIRAATPEEIEAMPGASTEPFIHAWAEWHGAVYAPSLIERMGGLHPMERLSYYEVNGVSNIKRLSRPALLRVAKQIGLSRHLLKHVPTKDGASVGGTLLTAAGVAFTTTPNGGLIPAATDMEPSHDSPTA